jgi:hypothetical protein
MMTMPAAAGALLSAVTAGAPRAVIDETGQGFSRTPSRSPAPRLEKHGISPTPSTSSNPTAPARRSYRELAGRVGAVDRLVGGDRRSRRGLLRPIDSKGRAPCAHAVDGRGAHVDMSGRAVGQDRPRWWGDRLRIEDRSDARAVGKTPDRARDVETPAVSNDYRTRRWRCGSSRH